MKTTDSSIDERFSKVEYALEANSFETMCLYKERPEDIEWKEHSGGYGITAGFVGDIAIIVSTWFLELNGKFVLVYEPTSTVVDWLQVEEWIHNACPNLKRKTNAMNFHNILNDVRRETK